MKRLPPWTERTKIEVQRSFHNISRGRTALVIAHRLATIQNAGQIIIMEDGRILAKGTHAQLLRNSAQYRKLMGGQLTAAKGGDSA